MSPPDAYWGELLLNGLIPTVTCESKKKNFEQAEGKIENQGKNKFNELYLIPAKSNNNPYCFITLYSNNATGDPLMLLYSGISSDEVR